MKKLLFLFILILLPMLASAQTVSNVQNSGCLNKTRGEYSQGVPTIVLTKEGSTLSVQVLNFESNCCTDDFNITSSISGSSDGEPCSVSISVNPVGEYDCDCICPYNVSFSIHDLEPNSFYLNCWWYKGLVELTEGKPLVLEYKIESVIIDGISFNLLKVMHKAKLTKWTTAEKEIRIPSEVTYGGENYIVTCIDHNAFGDLDYVTTITIPKTIRSTDLDVDGIIWANPFRECKSLEWIEVEEGCPLLNSVDGVLFAGNKTMLLGYPIASPRETYTVPEGVTIIRSGAFHHNKYLRKLVIPEEVTYLGWHLFNDTKCLEEIYIKGVLNPECMDDDLFGGMSTNVNIYVLPSEVDKFKAIYKGPVYPLPEQTNNLDTPKYFPTGMTWEEIVVDPFMEQENVNACIYEIGTDTIIGDITYKKVLKDNVFSGLCVRESGDKVWLLAKEYPTEILLYNFDWDSNQEIVTEYLKGKPHMVQDEEDYEVRQETIPVGDSQTVEIEGRTYQYIMQNLSGTIIRGIGKVAELNRYPCLLSYREPAEIPPGLDYHKVHWIKRNGVEIFRSESAKEWIEEIKDDYRPFVEEGKVWKVATINPADPSEAENDYYDILGRRGRVWNSKTYVIEGDTVIGGVTYKKLLSDGKFVCGMREEDGCVYGCGWSWASSELLLYDFNAQPGDVFMSADGLEKIQVKHVREVNIKGQNRRCLEMYHYEVDEKGEEFYGGFADYWIEGIGCTGYPDNPFWWDIVGNYPLLLSCYDGDKCILNIEDFNAQTTTNPVDNIAYRPFVEEGKVWKVGHVQTILDNSVNVVDYYYFDGDTIIDGKTCKQMMCQRYVSPDYSNEYGTPTPSLTKVGAWYEEDKKVYFYNEWQQSMKLKYDFSLAANDTLKFLTDGSSPFIIGPKQTGGIEGFKGVYRDIRMCGDEGQSYHDTFWLEGVGCLRGPIRNPCDPIFGDPVPEFLMSCTVGEEVIYLNDAREDGATPEGARKKRFDFTHTIKTKPKARIRRGEAQSLYGEYNDQQLGINLDPLDDDYLVSITDESDEVVYEKAVNAGSIVALNIDISAYAKGHYTVTIENNDEVFTGEFGTETTGIQELKNSRIEKLKSIYNLQGQRLNSLQKGLNIVNGQKVYVK